MDYLRADLLTIRRPNTYVTVRDMQRIHEHVEDSRRLTAQPEDTDVEDDMDNGPDSTTPPPDPDLDDEEEQGSSSAPAPPSRQERMNATPRITQSRWAAILARHPPGDA
eukprot:767718-Pyramimonas_sp.AAC.1